MYVFILKSFSSYSLILSSLTDSLLLMLSFLLCHDPVVTLIQVLHAESLSAEFMNYASFYNEIIICLQIG